MYALICYLSLLIFQHAQLANACNGYALKVNYLRNCNGGNYIIKPINVNVVLDNECNLSSSGCVDITRGYKTALLTVTYSTSIVRPVHLNINTCNSMANPFVTQIFQLIGLPTKCPVEKNKIYLGASNKIDMSMYKNSLGLAKGTTLLKFEIQHDNGRSCLECSYNLNKK